MDTPAEYIKHVIVKCRARYIIYHTTATQWSRAHWVTGIINGLIAATISIMSFVAENQGIDTRTVGMVGGLVLTISTSIITSLKTGQNQIENEKAGDEYRNLEEKILAEFSDTNVNYDELKDRCQQKLEKLTNQYQEPNPQKSLPLEEMLYAKIFEQV